MSNFKKEILFLLGQLAIISNLSSNRIVPYEIPDGDTFTQQEKDNIEKAIQHWEELTCLDFQERTDQANYIRFQV